MVGALFHKEFPNGFEEVRLKLIVFLQTNLTLDFYIYQLEIIWKDSDPYGLFDCRGHFRRHRYYFDR